jgi:hypothetical protein
MRPGAPKSQDENHARGRLLSKDLRAGAFVEITKQGMRVTEVPVAVILSSSTCVMVNLSL